MPKPDAEILMFVGGLSFICGYIFSYVMHGIKHPTFLDIDRRSRNSPFSKETTESINSLHTKGRMIMNNIKRNK